MPVTTQFFSCPPGSGKTASEVAYILDYWLPYEDGTHYSNLPLHIDEIATEAVRRYGKKGMTEESVRQRLVIISDDEFERWIEKKDRHPIHYFENIDLTGCRVFLDEVHYIANSRDPQAWKDLWQKWLGMIRHEKATICFASQADSKVASYIRDHCIQRVSLMNHEELPDIWTGIKKSLLYELNAKMTGEWRPFITRRVETKQHSKWLTVSTSHFHLGNKIYKLYDSFNKPHHKEVKEEGDIVEGEKSIWDEDAPVKRKPTGDRLYTRLSWGELLWYVAKDSWYPVLKRLLIVGGIVWLVLFGGARWSFDKFFYFMNKAMPKPKTEHKDESEAAVVEGGPVAVEVQKQLDELRQKEKEYKNLIIAQETALKKYKDQEERQKSVQAIGPDFITTSGGFTYRIGEVINQGPLKGRKVTAIHARFRSLVLDGKEVLWLAH